MHFGRKWKMVSLESVILSQCYNDIIMCKTEKEGI